MTHFVVDVARFFLYRSKTKVHRSLTASSLCLVFQTVRIIKVWFMFHSMMMMIMMMVVVVWRVKSVPIKTLLQQIITCLYRNARTDRNTDVLTPTYMHTHTHTHTHPHVWYSSQQSLLRVPLTKVPLSFVIISAETSFFVIQHTRMALHQTLAPVSYRGQKLLSISWYQQNCLMILWHLMAPAWVIEPSVYLPQNLIIRSLYTGHILRAVSVRFMWGLPGQ